MCVCVCVCVCVAKSVAVELRCHATALIKVFLMSLKIAFHFHPNVVIGTQIDKYGTEYTNFYEDTMYRHPVHMLYCIRPFSGISTL